MRINLRRYEKNVCLCLSMAILVCQLCACANSGLKKEKEEFSESEFYAYTAEEYICYEGGKKIYGKLYLPEREGRIPIVIFSHGLNSNADTFQGYAVMLAAMGIASYCFDYCGGSEYSRSDGSLQSMSVMSEVLNLETVLKEVQSWEFADPDKIMLIGASQGGAVAAICAARHEAEIAGLLLFAPAFSIPDMIHEMYDDLGKVPEETEILGQTVGRKYFEDMWEYDFYDEIGRYQKNVMIVHGTDDEVIDILYSEYALRKYADAVLKRVRGGEHSLEGAEKYILEYLQDNEILCPKEGIKDEKGR